MSPIFLIGACCEVPEVFLVLLWEVQRLTSPGNHCLCSASATLQLYCYTRFVTWSLRLLPWTYTGYCPAWGSTVTGSNW